jgi:hypothetical protein
MFSLFRSKKAPAATAESAAEHAKRMDLEERKAFRREMLYQSIRESFLSMEVVGSMYKFKVMPVDERHHRFIAMIDVAKSFVTGREARTKSFAALEKTMRANTYKRFGILIEGTYWRVSESESQFEHVAGTRARTADLSGTKAVNRAVEQRKVDSETPAAQVSPTTALARHDYHPVSEEEANAFMEAVRQGLAPPVVRSGDREYQSDLAPLDSGIMIGGTQYGKL